MRDILIRRGGAGKSVRDVLIRRGGAGMSGGIY